MQTRYRAKLGDPRANRPCGLMNRGTDQRGASAYWLGRGIIAALIAGCGGGSPGGGVAHLKSRTGVR